MTVLGALCTVLPMGISLRVADDKADKWTSQLKGILDVGRLSPGEAAKLAGRLSFAVTVTANKVGRAYVKPFFAQAHDPLPHDALSPLLRESVRWWLQYLSLRPLAIRLKGITVRPTVYMWTDAAGESRWLAAVVYAGGKYYWTRMLTPDVTWNMLLPRMDNQIGFQEFLAVLLGLESFQDILTGTLLTCYIDNEGVRSAMHRGSCRAAEVNLGIGYFWLQAAERNMCVWLARVESEANIADGPTRNCWTHLQKLGANKVEPKLPSWAMDIWRIPCL
eukprot:6465766-Amphidinium_carterae.1